MTGDPAEREALREELASIFAEETRDEWAEELADVDAAVGGVYRPSETFEHPQIEARGYVDRGGGALRVGSPLRGSDVPEGGGSAPPGRGKHTDELLREVGLGAEEIDRLREEGAIS